MPEENPMGLGGLVAPRSEQGGGSWTSMLQDPVARSALLSFGLQAMTGGWGNGTQQLAAAVGAGAQGAEGTANAIRAQELNNRDFQAKQEEGAANRASHEKISAGNQASRQEVANITADSRRDVEASRHESRMARIQAQLAQDPKILHEYNSTYARALAEGQKNQIISRKTDEQVRQDAVNAADVAIDRAIKAQQAHKAGQPVGGQPGAAASAAPSASGYRNDVTLDQIMSSAKSGPDAQQKMQTPEGRAALQAMFPHITLQQIEQYAKNKYLY